ncbi:hypothetical protein [Metabacillus fastidiosus]
MKGQEIIELIEAWLSKNNVHPDDFNQMFATDLLEILSEDK